MSETEFEPMISRGEVAARLDIPMRTLNRWASLGTGPRYYRLGRHARYRWTEVLAWVESQGSKAKGA